MKTWCNLGHWRGWKTERQRCLFRKRFQLRRAERWSKLCGVCCDVSCPHGKRGLLVILLLSHDVRTWASIDLSGQAGGVDNIKFASLNLELGSDRLVDFDVVAARMEAKMW